MYQSVSKMHCVTALVGTMTFRSETGDEKLNSSSCVAFKLYQNSRTRTSTKNQTDQSVSYGDEQ